MSPKTCHCGRSFAKREHFERHRRTHTNEKPFACSECGRAFGRHDSLLRHARSHAREHGDRSSRSESTASKTPVATDREPSLPSTLEPGGNHGLTTLPSMDQFPLINGQGAASLEAHVNPSWNVHGTSIPSELIRDRYDNWGLPQNYAIDESWLLGANFDVGALDDSVTAAIASWGQPMPNSNYLPPTQSPSDVILQQLSTEVDSPVPPKATSAVQMKWYTNITPSASAYLGASGREEQDRVDERYRSSLSTHLRTQMTDDALPSADFLNRCISLYFSKFHPIFPIIHAPSFRPSTEKALLLLSVCSMGAVLMGTTYAAAQGRRIFQKLNKAVLSTWEKHISRGREEILALAQSSVIGQTVALMSGHSTDLYLAESFHGTVIAWGRRAGMFKVATSDMSRERVDSMSSLDKLWRDWAHTESRSRVGLALYLHDSLFSSIFHHEPLLRHDASKIPHCGSDEAYNAATAADWFRLATNPTPSRFNACVNLAGIIALIIEARRGTMDSNARTNLEQLLMAWRSSNQTKDEDVFCSMIMWHQACMSLRTDLDVIEAFIGRDGFAVAEEAIQTVEAWYLTEGVACVGHALQIRNHAERLPAGKEPAIHVPRALFHAGIVIYAFVRMRQMSQGSGLVSHANDGPNTFAPLSGSDNGLQTASNADIGVVCNIADLLRRVGHWELSRKLASILDPLLEEAGHE